MAALPLDRLKDVDAKLDAIFDAVFLEHKRQLKLLGTLAPALAGSDAGFLEYKRQLDLMGNFSLALAELEATYDFGFLECKRQLDHLDDLVNSIQLNIFGDFVNSIRILVNERCGNPQPQTQILATPISQSPTPKFPDSFPSSPTPKSQNPTATIPNINPSIAKLYSCPSTPPNTTPITKQYTIPQSQTLQIETPTVEIKTENLTSNTSLWLHGISEDDQHKAANAQNVFDEMLFEPKSTTDESEADSISENSPGGPKMDDEVLGRRIFVKDRGKREVNTNTSFVISDFVVEADQAPLDDEVAVEKLEAEREDSSRGVKIVEEIRIDPDFIDEIGVEPGIELKNLCFKFGNHYKEEKFPKLPSVVKDRGKQEPNMTTNFVLRNSVAKRVARKLEPAMEDLSKNISKQGKGQMELISKDSAKGLRSDDERLVEREFVKDRGKLQGLVVGPVARKLKSVVEKLGIKPNFTSTELENQNVVCPWDRGLSRDLLWPEIARQPIVEHHGCSRRITSCTSRRAMTPNQRISNPDDELMVAWSRRVEMDHECAKLENQNNEELFARFPRFVKDRGKLALAGCRRLVKDSGKLSRAVNQQGTVNKTHAQHGSGGQLASWSWSRRNWKNQIRPEQKDRRRPNDLLHRHSLRRKNDKWAWTLICFRVIVKLDDGQLRAEPHQTHGGCDESWMRHNAGERGLAWCRWIAWSGGVLKLGNGWNKPWPRRIGCGPKADRRNLRDDWFRQISRMMLDLSRKSMGERREAWNRQIVIDSGRIGFQIGDRAKLRGQNGSLKLMRFVTWVLNGMKNLNGMKKGVILELAW